MAYAEVGDMVYGEDPTVRELEERTAEILGKEAALFMPSGTMSNQVAVRSHTEHGDELIMDYKTHIHYYEVGGAAALSGVISASQKPIPGPAFPTIIPSPRRPSKH